jgi:hypothetical protein
MSVLDVLQVVPMVPAHMPEAVVLELLQAGPPTTLEKEQLQVDPLLVAKHATKEGRTLAVAPSTGRAAMVDACPHARVPVCLCVGGGGGGENFPHQGRPG